MIRTTTSSLGQGSRNGHLLDQARQALFAPSLELRGTQRVDLDDAPFWDEVKAFNRLAQSEVDEYYGRYVAVYQGNIVDSDVDEGELALRFYRTFGYVPVYIHKVGTEDGLVVEVVDE